MTKAQAKKEYEHVTPGALLYYVEYNILSHSFAFQDSTDWRDSEYTPPLSWIKSLVDDGCFELLKVGSSHDDYYGNDRTRKKKEYKFYEYGPNEKGLRWWAQEVLKQSESPADYTNLLRGFEGGVWWPPSVEGKGIGAVIGVNGYGMHTGPFLAVVRGILDGYFEFVSMYRYWSERTMTVRLTEKGYEFFRTLPRLELECA